MAQILQVPETHSTNDDILRLSREGAEEGLWLRAERQTRGRGRQGRSWQSAPGNLYASTLIRLRPHDPPAPTLALVAGVALHEVVASLAASPELRLKWPNDLMLAGAKLGGILLEREGEAVVIGFGLNIAHHPADLKRPVTSLAAVGVAVDPATVAGILTESLARWIARWRSDGLAPIRARWLAAAHPPGTALATSEGKGLFDGLDESGALMLRLADGNVRVIHAGDVFLI
jgi:BirA family biotin operon repressor/biotin-[acetyl-CoA-carboxylase] ligase